MTTAELQYTSRRIAEQAERIGRCRELAQSRALAAEAWGCNALGYLMCNMPDHAGDAARVAWRYASESVAFELWGEVSGIAPECAE